MTKSNNVFAAKRIAIAVATVCASLAMPAFAADNKALLDLMLKKGVITQAEYEQFAEAAENENFKEKRLHDDVSKLNKLAEKNKDTGSVLKDGLGIQSADGNFTAKLTGRMHLDARSFDSEFTNGKEYLVAGIKGGDTFELRRARLGVAGTFYKDFDYLLLLNMTGSDTNNVEEAFVNYKANPALNVRVGRFKQPYNMEEVATSSNNIDFMQRSYVNALAPAKQLGFMLHGVPVSGTTYAASIYQTGFAQISASGSYESAGRLTANFAELAAIPNAVLHLGVAGTDGRYEVAGTASQAALVTIRDEARGLDVFKWTENAGATTTSILVDKQNMGLELAAAYGPFKFQAESAETKFGGTKGSDGTDFGSGKIKTQYVVAMYNLTGENWADTYKNGGFGATKPTTNFSLANGGWGAWQVGVRYSKYDASDLQLVNGTSATGSSASIAPKGNTVTYGLNWMLNPNARIMLNYSVTKFDADFTPVSGGNAGNQETVVALRTQINF